MTHIEEKQNTHIDFVPVKEVFKTFKEVNQLELVRQAGIRQQYIDQAVSLNLAFPKEATPKWINQVHLEAWKTGVKTLGLIDNMSFFKGDDGKEYKIFGEGGVEKTAKEFSKNFLGKIPLNQDLRNSADKGEPLTHSDPEHEVSKIFKEIAEKVKSLIN